jgi:phosphoglycolate phosphatase-like HAD superfamily hydrolase
MWHPVSSLAFGAEGSGHKRETVAKAIAATGLPKHRIVYIGDNLNDVDAGLSNGVHFIGFSESGERRARLTAAGARHLSGDHATTARLISGLLTQ